MVFKSAEENEEAMCRMGVEQRMRQLGRGEFRCDMAVSERDDVVLVSDRFSTSVSIRLQPPAGMVGFLFGVSTGGQLLASGGNVANDKLVVFPDGCGADLVMDELAGSESFLIPSERFKELIETLCPTPKSTRPNRMTAIAGNTARLQTIRKALAHQVAHPEFDPRGETVANLVAAAISWMGESSNQCRPEGFNGNGIRRRIAKRTQEFIEEQYRDPVNIADLCRVNAVGVRTLQRCFREYFDLTIWEYLKAVRFDAVHRALLPADPARDTVTAIAIEHGHTHLGRFSVEYRERFGESPRMTLAKQAGGMGSLSQRAPMGHGARGLQP